MSKDIILKCFVLYKLQNIDGKFTGVKKNNKSGKPEELLLTTPPKGAKKLGEPKPMEVKFIEEFNSKALFTGRIYVEDEKATSAFQERSVKKEESDEAQA